MKTSAYLMPTGIFTGERSPAATSMPLSRVPSRKGLPAIPSFQSRSATFMPTG